MPNWVRLDSARARHPKVRAAAAIEPLAPLLYLNSLTEVADAYGDGIVRAFLLADYGHLSGLTARRLHAAAAALVTARLWHDAENWKGCHCIEDPEHGWERKLNTRFVPLGAGDFLVHDYFGYQLPPRSADVDDLARKHDARRKRLYRAGDLTAQVRMRDRDQCRYCRIDVIFGGNVTRGPRVGTFDHVDPYLEQPDDNTLANVVVSCKPCNVRKKDRTPDAAGMELLSAPVPAAVTA